MPATRDGIYHDLRESTYTITENEVTYYFSSELYQTKFENEIERNREKYIWFFQGKKLGLNFNVLADLSLYCIIEKRGFRVRIKGDVKNWQDARKYAIQRLLKNCTTG